MGEIKTSKATISREGIKLLEISPELVKAGITYDILVKADRIVIDGALMFLIPSYPPMKVIDGKIMAGIGFVCGEKDVDGRF